VRGEYRSKKSQHDPSPRARGKYLIIYNIRNNSRIIPTCMRKTELQNKTDFVTWNHPWPIPGKENMLNHFIKTSQKPILLHKKVTQNVKIKSDLIKSIQKNINLSTRGESVADFFKSFVKRRIPGKSGVLSHLFVFQRTECRQVKELLRWF